MKHQFAGGSTFLISLLITGFCGAGDIARCDSLDIIPSPIAEGPTGHFGAPLAIAGDNLFVGRYPAYPDPDLPRLFIYRRGERGWTLQQELLPGRPLTEDVGFASKFAVQGEHAFVAASQDDEAGLDAGAVYHYRLIGGAWVLHDKLTAPDAEPGDEFGAGLDYDGLRLVVGAPGADIPQFEDTGVAYSFIHNGDTLAFEAKVVPLTIDFPPVIELGLRPGDRYGAEVALDGDAVLIAAPFDTTLYEYSGAIYAFDHNGASWVENEKILPEGVPIGMLGYTTFGGNMEMRGLWAMVGLSQVAAGQGRVVPLKRAGGGWVQQPLLPAVEPSAFSYFGSSLAIDDDLMLVGAPGVHQPGRLQDTGAVYVFQLEADEWMQQQEILAPETKALLGDLFGAGLALQNGSAFVGAPRAPFTVVLGGGVYAFDGVPFDDCNGNSIDDACDIESGVSADVDGDGVPDECARPCLCPADLDCNGIVNGLDLALLLGAWGKCAGGSGCPADLNGDDVVNGFDLALLLGAWS